MRIKSFRADHVVSKCVNVGFGFFSNTNLLIRRQAKAQIATKFIKQKSNSFRRHINQINWPETSSKPQTYGRRDGARRLPLNFPP